MSTNIVEIVQNDLGYPAIQKIDPNSEKTKQNNNTSSREKLAQSAIPAVLAGFFSFTRNDKGCNYILAGGGRKNWLDTLFGDKKEMAVEKITHYAGTALDDTAVDMEDIAREAVIIIHEAPGEKPTAEKLRSYMSGQRHNILAYLPPELQLGELLNDNAMDDQTNKMEGPVSSLMHSIENKLSGGGS
ncbi:MAG: hypothetical protein ABI675_24535 [Chitinophagaceae bacterium]